MSHHILICDDDDLIRKAVSAQLEAAGHEASTVPDGEACVHRALRNSYDAILLDIQMPGLDGLGTLRKLRESGVDVPVLVMTAFGDIESAIEATHLGAFCYLTKPLNFDEVYIQVQNAVEQTRLRQEVSRLREKTHGEDYGKLVGKAPAMRNVYETLSRLEAVNAPTVLIHGESGTGKDLVAQAIHTQGPRAGRPFMEIDCASLPENLIEAELFGYERGAFTDAQKTKPGLFEVAGDGTIFLDEIGEMALATQAKFLRALENRQFKRLGGVVNHSLHAAIIAATNRDLRAEVEKGNFREDLFFRLNVIPIQVPPLRERAEDIPLLVHHFLQRFNRELGRDTPPFSDETVAILSQYHWPGNVRELKNVIERIVILGGMASGILPSHLPPEIRFAEKRPAPLSPGASTDGSGRFRLPPAGINLEDVEKDFLVQALELSAGRRGKAAELLGISRHALRYRMQKYDLEDSSPG